MLDILSIISFALQVENQSNIYDIAKLNKELSNFVEEVRLHLNEQDIKIDRVLQLLENNNE